MNRYLYKNLKHKPIRYFLKILGVSIAAIAAIESIHASPTTACQMALESKSTGSNRVLIGNFSNGSLRNWEAITFSELSDYDIFNFDNIKALRARSQGTASGLIYKQRIDLLKTPLLNWCWRIERALLNNNEAQRSGDDFAARIYVVVDGGLVFWNTKALNYVWAAQKPTGELWENPYGGRSAMMLALRSKQSPLRTWVGETRNVYEDLKRAFGHPIRYIDAIAVMTDTDDTGSTALTYYGDIYFSAK